MSRKIQLCTFSGCSKIIYAKNLCASHYQKSRYKKLKRKPCPWPECHAVILASREFCSVHQKRAELRRSRGLPLTVQNLLQGKYNHRWRGGVASYPKHSKMKILRKRLIKERGNRCEICGCKPKRIDLHHLDQSKTRHTENNALLLCHKCHMSKFHNREKTKRHDYNTKFNKLYGLTAAAIAKQMHVAISTVYRWHGERYLQEALCRKKIKC